MGVCSGTVVQGGLVCNCKLVVSKGFCCRSCSEVMNCCRCCIVVWLPALHWPGARGAQSNSIAVAAAMAAPRRRLLQDMTISFRDERAANDWLQSAAKGRTSTIV